MTVKTLRPLSTVIHSVLYKIYFIDQTRSLFSLKKTRKLDGHPVRNMLPMTSFGLINIVSGHLCKYQDYRGSSDHSHQPPTRTH